MAIHHNAEQKTDDGHVQRNCQSVRIREMLRRTKVDHDEANQNHCDGIDRWHIKVGALYAAEFFGAFF